MDDMGDTSIREKSQRMNVNYGTTIGVMCGYGI